jgi:hypothetical protein
MKRQATKAKSRATRAKARAAKPKRRRPAASKADAGQPKHRTARKAKPKKPSAKRGPRTLARAKGSRRAIRRPRAQPPGIEDAGHVTGLHEERLLHHETSPALSAGDVDADWADAEGSGEESVGGSVATPDQDVVDEIGRALGVEQAPTQPVTSSEEILRERARHRWELEREASEEADRREQ